MACRFASSQMRLWAIRLWNIDMLLQRRSMAFLQRSADWFRCNSVVGQSSTDIATLCRFGGRQRCCVCIDLPAWQCGGWEIPTRCGQLADADLSGPVVNTRRATWSAVLQAKFFWSLNDCMSVASL